MNKIKYGLKNVHYAVITETDGTITYDTPKKIPGSISLVQDPVGENVLLYADDQEYVNEDLNNGYDGSIEFSDLPDEFRVDVLGDTEDSNGALIENAEAKAKKIALLFEFDGDVNKTRHVMYYVKVSRPSVSSNTKTNTKTPATDVLTIQARPRPDTKDIKAKLTSDKTGYDSFFETVYEPVPVEV